MIKLTLEIVLELIWEEARTCMLTISIFQIHKYVLKVTESKLLLLWTYYNMCGGPYFGVMKVVYVDTVDLSNINLTGGDLTFLIMYI